VSEAKQDCLIVASMVLNLRQQAVALLEEDKSRFRSGLPLDVAMQRVVELHQRFAGAFARYECAERSLAEMMLILIAGYIEVRGGVADLGTLQFSNGELERAAGGAA
jgi:hypothetical protein